MGITAFSVSLIEGAINAVHPNTVIELGSQNLYLTNADPPPFASSWYIHHGFHCYECIDLAGDNYAWKIDLSQPIDKPPQFDLVTDFGSSEHVVQMSEYTKSSFHEGRINSIYPSGEIISIEIGYYNCWLNKFNLCKIGGAILSENPKTGNWPGHGYSYIDMDFYKKLELMADVKIMALGEHGAMGNWKDGVNVYSILKKTGERFPDLETFKALPLKQS